MGKSIVIDEDRCDGCGLCVDACHEGVIELVDGKAKATKAWLCDGIGDCLPACPQGAITFTEESAGMPNLMVPAGGQEVQWPVKIELVSDRNPFFDGKDLLIAADCSAFKRDVIGQYGGGAVIIGCPKLAKVDEDKLCRIVANNDIRSITVVRMEVPCCSPLAKRAEYALKQSGKDIPFRTVVLRRDGTPQPASQ